MSGIAQISAYPAAEALVIEILSSLYAPPTYYVSPIVPDTLRTVTISVEGITGVPANIRLDKPVLELSAITSKHISGDAGYAVGDQLCHNFWVDLYNVRGQQWNNGVVTDVKVVAGPHRIVDVNVDTFRFATTLQLTTHA
jgi:hypothetical protein